MISKANVIKQVNRIFEVVESNRDLILEKGGDAEAIRFFDLITIMSFLEFADHKCQWVVLECGLGGRLDATNVIRPPVCVAITSIGLDHTDVLGESLPEIALEKSKIIKPGILGCVLGPTCHQDQDVFSVFEQQLEEVAASDVLVKVESKGINEINTEIATILIKQAFDFTDLPGHLSELLTQTRQQCRFERVENTSSNGPKTIILDVCHNPQSFEVTFNQIKEDFGAEAQITIVLGQAMNKEASYIVDLIRKYEQIENLFVVSTPHMRLKTIPKIMEQIEELKSQAETKGIFEKIKVVSQEGKDSNIKQTLDTVLNDSSKNKHVVLVCGSFFIMTEVKVSLGLLENSTDMIDYI